MKSHFLNNKKSVFFLLLWLIFSGIMPVAKPIFGSAPAGRTGRPLSSSERSAYEDRKALEAYNKRNAQIDSRIHDVVTPSHNNAALLYYQAFLLMPEPKNQATFDKIYDVYGGAEPDIQIRTFLGKCLPAFELFEITSLMPQCTWGVWPEQQKGRNLLAPKLRGLSSIISADASTLAADGHYRAALEQCLTLRRIARHISEDPELKLFPLACDRPALRTIRLILGKMPPDADVLAWFKGQLASVQVTSPILEITLQGYLQAKMDMVQSYSIVSLRGMLLKRGADERAKQNIRDLTDEEIRHQATETVQGLFGSISAILDSGKSAEQKRAELQELANYVTKTDVLKPLMNIYNELGEDIARLITGTDLGMTEEQKLPKIQNLTDKLAEPNTVELLTRFSSALGEEIDFGSLADSELTDKQRLVKMQKVINELSETYIIEVSTFESPMSIIDSLFESQVRHTAQIRSIEAAVSLYLIMARTGQLPKELPDYLAKDPYTGLDFLYEITDDGFVLGCQSDIFKRGKERFTFDVQKKSD